MRLRLLLVVCAGLSAAARAPRDEAPRGDGARLQGVWQCTSEVIGGDRYEGKLAPTVVLSFTGRQFRADVFGLKILDGEYKLRPFEKPKAIDLPTGAGRFLPGIYVLDGNTLKLCYGLDGRRPAKLASIPGSKVNLFVLRRQENQPSPKGKR